MIKNLLFIIITIGLSINSYASDTCLVACYPFSGNANNALGTGFDGVISGAVLTTDRFGNANSAYYFDGTSYINIGRLENINNTDEFGYSFWCATDMAGTTNMPIRTQPDNSSDRMAFSIHYVGGAPTRLFFDNGDIYSTGRLGIGNQPFDNLWHHYVFTRSTISNFKKVYIDGVLFASDVAGDILDDKTRKVFIGGGIHESGSNEFYQGKIDDVQIFKCALDATEVNNLYLQTNSCLDDTYVENVNSSLNFSMYPVPSNSQVNIETTNNIIIKSVEIINTVGEIVLSNHAENIHSVDISNLNKGIYLIKINSQVGSNTKKLIVE